ncbi:MAG: 4Fe-4S dicluster domain-containing protein [Candidatus Omnitrophica bacterium]|nr:4Fe-4S dicluster domain-containing protein [Candidatus Omnitrophota bacterium]
MEKLYTINKKNLYDLFSRLAEDSRVLVPYKKNEALYFGEFDPKREDLIELGVIRQSQPVKSFLTTPRETVFDGPKKGLKPLILAGVKACDLSSFVLQDYVFMKGDFEDPSYIENRKNTTIIAVDCTMPKETCFCIAMDGMPYPRTNFDMGLSVMDNVFLVEAATDKGKAIIDSYRMFFKDAGAKERQARQANRDRVCKDVKDFIAKRNTPGTSQIKGAVKKYYNELQLWQDFSSTCVECGACNLVCPTCHCFILFDEKAASGARRQKVWDSCLYKTFARVAGGANPRKHLYERLRNRFDKKFDFFPEVLDYFACTGCGRCIEACPGDIDIREVLKGLVLGKWNKPPHD